MQSDASKIKAHTVDQLNSFLRGELSAVETYRQALTRLKDFAHRDVLELCATSHQQRVAMLTDEVRQRGAEPAKSSGAWGAFAKMLEGGSTVLGAKVAIATLEEGEDHGRDDYDRDIEKLDANARMLVAQRLMPEQVRTHGAMSKLKKQL